MIMMISFLNNSYNVDRSLGGTAVGLPTKVSKIKKIKFDFKINVVEINNKRDDIFKISRRERGG